MAAKRNPVRASRSPKAGRPPEASVSPPRIRRRQKTASAAVRKDTTLLQSGEDPRARWPAAKPKFKKR